MFAVNVEGAVYKGDKWLIIERSKKEENAGGLLSFVGGTVENEGNAVDVLERTLKREILEEVGVTIKDTIHFVTSTSFIANSGATVLDIVFLCEHLDGEPYAKSPDEVESVHWLTKDEIIRHKKTPVWLRENMEIADRVKQNLIAPND